jgi:uncharacterized membrane protein HdeD (DUF308 family)
MNDKSSLGDSWLAGLEAVRRDSGWFLVLGILLMVLGVMALAAAGLMTLGTMVFFGCLLIVGGVISSSTRSRCGNGVASSSTSCSL